MRSTRTWKIAAVAALLAPPAGAQEAAAVDCAAAAGERAALAAEQAALQAAIGDIALGRHPKRKKKGRGGEVARGVAGAAASILLPFPLGLAVGAAGAATRGKSKARPEPAAPDAAALIARQQAVEGRLAEIAQACG